MNNKIKLIGESLRSKKLAMLLYYAKFGNFYSDEEYLRKVFPLHMGYELDLDNPKTFSEKLQWLKLYNRDPKYVKMVDKIEAKKYVASIIGEEYVVPTYATYNDVSEIDFDALPDQFVLKTTHAGGSVGVVICHDKTTFDKKAALNNLSIAMKRDHSKLGREWVYSKIKPRIIAEQLLEVKTNNAGDIYDLPDYKFFCFDGKVKALFVGSERQTGNVKFDFFDEDFNHLDFIQGHPNLGRCIPKPTRFDQMKELAEKLSKGLPHARIDLYDTGNNIYFGEITFFHFSGFTPFEPKEWDYTFGSWITLPNKRI